jgi:hypothetical protein
LNQCPITARRFSAEFPHDDQRTIGGAHPDIGR